MNANIVLAFVCKCIGVCCLFVVAAYFFYTKQYEYAVGAFALAMNTSGNTFSVASLAGLKSNVMGLKQNVSTLKDQVQDIAAVQFQVASDVQNIRETPSMPGTPLAESERAARVTPATPWPPTEPRADERYPR